MTVEKVESLDLAETYLKEGRVLCFVSGKLLTRVVIRKDKIHVFSDAAHYALPWEEFKELFFNEIFYLYEIEEEHVEISKEKDEEYYGWYHK